VAPWSSGLQLGRYTLVAPIGAGGMGEVWKAHDTRLNRRVAIKRLSAGHGHRFEQEARAIAALNHPHVCQIYDVGPDYLVLEYIEGTPLSGPVPPDEAVRLALQVASALEAAHRRGILHRDLKPANILLTRGGGPTDPPAVKLLDFGLAKLADTDADATRTTDGTIVGTAAYMAPEQAEGTSVDARSDIFSFGVVLYELVSGRRTFAGTAPQVLHAVLHQEPAPLDAPSVIADVVRRCLEKRPQDRFQTVAEVRMALERAAHALTTRDATDQRPSIAVLPFANLSADRENEYFSDGLAEEIINLLAHLPDLTVIARTSAFAFKGRQEDIRRIAEALGVTTVLEGSVRRSGNRIRVTAQLITASNGSHVWSERYDREMTDVFAIQDEIAEAIATALKVKLSLEPTTRRGGTTNLAAYEAYLKGRYYWAKLTADSLERSRECYEEAIRLDPSFALAHCFLGEHFFALAAAGARPARDVMPKARAAAEHAARIDPSVSEAQALLGSIAGFYDLDWVEAARHFRLAMAHEPVAPHARMHYGFHLLVTGLLSDARREYERATAEDPLNALCRTHLAWCLMAMRATDEAAAQLRKNLEIDPSPWTDYAFTLLHLVEGNLPDALASAERMRAAAPWSALAAGVLAGLLGRVGDTGRSQSILAELQPADAHGVPLGLAMFYLIRQEHERAADWFEKAIEQRETWIPLFVLRIGLLDRNPRRDALARMLKLPNWAELPAVEP
jgi:serine/threonine-protein kinase